MVLKVQGGFVMFASNKMYKKRRVGFQKKINLIDLYITSMG